MYQHLGVPMYEPKIIIPTEEQSEYKLMLFKEVIKFCEDNQPVNPFKTIYEEGEGLRIALNTTNDLPWAIRYWDNSDNWDSNIKHVILGDPNPNSYGKEVIMDCVSRCEHPSTFLFSKDWYMALINIDGTNKLVVNESKIKVI